MKRILFVAMSSALVLLVIGLPTLVRREAVREAELETLMGRTEAVYAALCGDAPVYRLRETQDELLQYVEYAELAYDIIDNDDHPRIAAERERLERIREIAKTAPTEQEPAELSKILSYPNQIVQVLYGKNRAAYFQVFTEPRLMIEFSNYGFPKPSARVERTPIKLKERHAIAEAESILAKIGIADRMELRSVEESAIDEAGYQIDLDDSTKKHAYILLYGETGRTDGDTVEIRIDDNGILYFCWEMTDADLPVQQQTAESPNILPPAIVVDGTRYVSTGREMPAEIDPSAIIGTVTGVVHGSQQPTEEGVINFPAPDAVYARVADGIAVRIEHEWVLFTLANEPM